MKHQPPHFKLDFTIEIGPNLSRVLIAFALLSGRLLALAPFFLLSGSAPGG